MPSVLPWNIFEFLIFNTRVQECETHWGQVQKFQIRTLKISWDRFFTSSVRHHPGSIRFFSPVSDQPDQSSLDTDKEGFILSNKKAGTTITFSQGFFLNIAPVTSCVKNHSNSFPNQNFYQAFLGLFFPWAPKYL